MHERRKDRRVPPCFQIIGGIETNEDRDGGSDCHTDEEPAVTLPIQLS